MHALFEDNINIYNIGVQKYLGGLVNCQPTDVYIFYILFLWLLVNRDK